MKRSVLLAALLFFWLAPDLESSAFKCLLTNKCAPPPCEFMRELKITKALQRVIARTPAAEFGGSKATDRFFGRVDKEMEKIVPRFTRCPNANPKPSLIVDSPACNIRLEGGVATDQSLALADLLKVSRTCSEIVEASFARAAFRQTACQAISNRASPETAAEFKAWLRLVEREKANALERSLLGYLSSCVPDASTSRQITVAGLDALKRTGQKARKKWEAKRAAEAGAR